MIDPETIGIYNAKAQDYSDKFSHTKPDQDLQRFIDAMPVGASVLDFGCGPGHAAAMLADAGLNVQATDASIEMVRMAQEKYEINAHQEQFLQLNAVDEFDGIWANFSLLHAPKAEFPDVLKLLKTAMKSGGILHLGLKIGDGENRDHLGRMYSFFQPDELKTNLITAGFTPTFERQGAGKGLAGTLDPFMIVNAHA